MTEKKVRWVWVWQATGRPLFRGMPFKPVSRSPEWWANELYLGDTDYGECLAQLVL